MMHPKKNMSSFNGLAKMPPWKWSGFNWNSMLLWFTNMVKQSSIHQELQEDVDLSLSSPPRASEEMTLVSLGATCHNFANTWELHAQVLCYDAFCKQRNHSIKKRLTEQKNQLNGSHRESQKNMACQHWRSPNPSHQYTFSKWVDALRIFPSRSILWQGICQQIAKAASSSWVSQVKSHPQTTLSCVKGKISPQLIGSGWEFENPCNPSTGKDFAWPVGTIEHSVY